MLCCLPSPRLPNFHMTFSKMHTHSASRSNTPLPGHRHPFPAPLSLLFHTYDDPSACPTTISTLPFKVQVLASSVKFPDCSNPQSFLIPSNTHWAQSCPPTLHIFWFIYCHVLLIIASFGLVLHPQLGFHKDNSKLAESSKNSTEFPVPSPQLLLTLTSDITIKQWPKLEN